MWPFRKRVREPNTGIPAIPVKFNCPASWGNMSGGDQIRHCTHCDRKVYNLSNMTSFEARSLMLREERSLCVRYYLRDDGMIMTKDCGIGKRVRFVSRMFIAAVLGVLGFPVLFTPVMGARPSPQAMAKWKAREALMQKMEQQEQAAERAEDRKVGRNGQRMIPPSAGNEMWERAQH